MREQTSISLRVRTNNCNTDLHSHCTRYWDCLSEAIDGVKDCLELSGFDTKELDGIYCGHDGRVNVPVGDNRHLSFVWHRMDVTRTYEIVAYIG